MSSIPGPEAIRDALAAHHRIDFPALPGRTNHIRAGVLVPLLWSPGREPVCIFTQRTSGLRHHSGEVCFPGGRPEPDDEDDLARTALREAREEVGIVDVRILGRLSSMPVYTSEHRLFPFVAQVPPQELVPEQREVRSVLLVPLDDMLTRSHIHAIPWMSHGQEVLSPVFEHSGLRIYGGTAHIFYELLMVLSTLTGLPLPPLRAGRYTWDSVRMDTDD